MQSKPPEDLAGFQVELKLNCPHRNHVNPESTTKIAQAYKDNSCCVCKHRPENWFCLFCSQTFCSRYIEGHSLKHFEQTGHCILISFSDLSVWCYSCNEYIASEVLDPAINLLHNAKFNLPYIPPTLNIPILPPTSVPKAREGHWFVNGLDESVLQNPVIDKLLGCIYGNALGDAVGLSTEFMDKKEIKRVYALKKISFPYFERNGHNLRWAIGDWTDDTDQMICIIDTILETGGEVSESVFAKRLKRWVKWGFPELGDQGGCGLGATVASVVFSEQFLSNPHQAAFDIWLKFNKNAAANGAVMRTSILGCYQFHDLKKVIENTIKIAKVTHYDGRCVGSCVAVTVAIALLLQGEKDLAKVQQSAIEISQEYVQEEHKKSFLEHLTVKEIQELNLDEGKSIGYTLKCVGSGLWGFRSTKSFKDTLIELSYEGGDADTNGAVCGALLGCRLGYSQLPKDWLSCLWDKEWLDQKVVQLLLLMKLINKEGKLDTEKTTQ